MTLIDIKTSKTSLRRSKSSDDSNNQNLKYDEGEKRKFEYKGHKFSTESGVFVVDDEI